MKILFGIRVLGLSIVGDCKVVNAFEISKIAF